MPRHSTNPRLTARRVVKLKGKLKVTYPELAVMFGVKIRTIKYWASGKWAPRLRHQRMLEFLERTHKVR